MSEYARKVLLNKPVMVTVRDVTQDRLIDSLNDLRTQLETLVNHKSLNADDKRTINLLLSEINQVMLKIVNECILKTVIPR